MRVKPVTYCCCISIATFRPGEVRRSGGLEVWRSGCYRSYRKRNFRSPSPPFAAANFRNRNIVLIQKEDGIILHLQDYKTFRTAGNDRIAIEVGC